MYSFNILNISSSITINFFIAGTLFFIASLTDMIDGYLARKNNWITNFGKIWDPIADKILINTIVISFSIKGYIPYFVPIFFIIRDTIVDAKRMSVSKDLDISANIYGKLKTIFQIIGILFIFFVCNDNNIDKNFFLSINWEYYIIQNLFILISLIASFISGYIYIQKTFNKFV